LVFDNAGDLFASERLRSINQPTAPSLLPPILPILLGDEIEHRRSRILAFFRGGFPHDDVAQRPHLARERTRGSVQTGSIGDLSPGIRGRDRILVRAQEQEGPPILLGLLFDDTGDLFPRVFLGGILQAIGQNGDDHLAGTILLR
jgi:hypothetical protein